MLKVHIQHDFLRDSFDVYFVNHHHDGSTELLRPINRDGHPMWDAVHTQEGTVRPEEPSMRMNRDLLNAFIEATRNITPASEATQAHLKDAIAIRDRLLTLIEKRS